METPIFVVQFTFYDYQNDRFIKRCAVREMPKAEKIGELFAKLAEEVAVTPTDVNVTMRDDEPLLGYISFEHYGASRTAFVDIVNSTMFE